MNCKDWERTIKRSYTEESTPFKMIRDWLKSEQKHEETVLNLKERINLLDKRLRETKVK